MRPLALDLFCKAGGASMGLHRAGFEVVGIDIEPQPNYPFPFIRADVSAIDFAGFNFIWASPPCQRWSVGSRRWHKRWDDQLTPLRSRLKASGALYCIENVPGAPLDVTLVLAGPMFGLKTMRRRHFEMNFLCLQPEMPQRMGPKTTPGFCTVAGNGGDGPNRFSAWCEAMNIHWMTKPELRQAVPPAYAEFIGRAALQHLTARKAA